MKDPKRPITDEELDALLSGSPIKPKDGFADRTLLKVPPVTEPELDVLLAGELVSVSPDFTDRTMARIEEKGKAMLFEFPATRWLIRSGMAAAVVLAGLFSYSVWNGQSIAPANTPIAESNLATMEFEELLYLEETLSSAKVLIELEKTVPLYYLIEEADS